MKYFKKDTMLVMNITDIDDKIINKSDELGVDWREVSKKYEDSFFDSMSKLGVQYPHTIIRVSEVIPHISRYIQKIMDNGFAYPTKDGSIYFDTTRYKEAGYEYRGNLEDVDKEQFPLEVSEISEISENGIRNTKKCASDFSLWKGRKQSEVGFDEEFNFESHIFKSHGRPGWHIECSTMIYETLGCHFDIHFGGIDLKFPHHYNENAQANAYHHPMYLGITNWCDSFYHIGHLCIEGMKMSKSLKNFTTINEILKTTSPNVLRWLFMKHKWREPMNYNSDTLKDAIIIDEQIKEILCKLENFPFERKYVVYQSKEVAFDNCKSLLLSKMDNCLLNFEFDQFVLLVQEYLKNINKYLLTDKINQTVIEGSRECILSMLNMLGFKYSCKQIIVDNNTEVFMDLIVKERTFLRMLSRKSDKEIKSEIYKILDEQRDTINKTNIQLKDTKESSLWFHSFQATD
jgi:cysteinyl-tRNA synthetase